MSGMSLSSAELAQEARRDERDKRKEKEGVGAGLGVYCCSEAPMILLFTRGSKSKWGAAGGI
jgi:hypothetical protein